jgi:coatomer subunit beta
VSKATGAGETKEDFASSLSRVVQLTGASNSYWNNVSSIIAGLGFSDPVYAEAYVKVHGFDILLGTFLYIKS